MKVRNGFVSNSSSCSYIVEFEEEIKSPKDLEKILNKNFWKYVPTNKWMRINKNNYPFERICELIFRLMKITDEKLNGKRILDNFVKDAPTSVPSYPKFRKKFLEDKMNKYYKDFIDSDEPEDFFYGEEKIWEEYRRLYSFYIKGLRIKDMIESGENLAYFSFGNETEYVSYDPDTDSSNLHGLSLEDLSFIQFLRDEDCASTLFWSLNWERKDYS